MFRFFCGLVKSFHWRPFWEPRSVISLLLIFCLGGLKNRNHAFCPRKFRIITRIETFNLVDLRTIRFSITLGRNEQSIQKFRSHLNRWRFDILPQEIWTNDSVTMIVDEVVYNKITNSWEIGWFYLIEFKVFSFQCKIIYKNCILLSLVTVFVNLPKV